MQNRILRVFLKAPVLTRSGYGEHARFVARSLRSRPDLFEVYIYPTNWGQTGWISGDSEERNWLDERIKASAKLTEESQPFDVSIQVTIPNEWERIAQVNIGVTAGIETDKVSPVWLEKANMMDKVVTISEHSRKGFLETIYEGVNKQTREPMTLGCTVPIDVVNYPVKTYETLPELDLNLSQDFNYLLVAQWGHRKNLVNTVRWFIEENIDQEVGLVIKSFVKNGSISDREVTSGLIKGIANQYADRKCKITLIHGDMTDEEMHSLYNHPKIKVLLSLTHGEGYGLPLFEAAYSGLPIIAPGWSGQCDFLYKENNKGVKVPHFAEVDYDLGKVSAESHWKGVIEEDASWCYPREGSYKLQVRNVRKQYSKWLKKATNLQTWIVENFEESYMMSQFITTLIGEAPVSPQSEK